MQLDSASQLSRSDSGRNCRLVYYIGYVHTPKQNYRAILARCGKHSRSVCSLALAFGRVSRQGENRWADTYAMPSAMECNGRGRVRV